MNQKFKPGVDISTAKTDIKNRTLSGVSFVVDPACFNKKDIDRLARINKSSYSANSGELYSDFNWMLKTLNGLFSI